MKNMTNWELGNEIMCGIVDKMYEVARECEKSHPLASKILTNKALDFGPMVNNLMEDTMCPERKIVKKESRQ